MGLLDYSFLEKEEDDEGLLDYSFVGEEEPERVNESTGEPLLKQQETYSLDRDTPDTEFGKVAERVKLMQTSGMGGVARSFAETPETITGFMDAQGQNLGDSVDPDNPDLLGAGSAVHQLLTDFVGSGIKTGLVDLADMFTAGDIRDDTKEATAIVSQEATRILGSPDMQYEGSDLGKFGYQVMEGAANMVPALVVGWGTKNPGAALGMMGAEVYGLTYNEYMDKTGDHYKSTAAAEFHTMAEIIPEMLPVSAILRPSKAGEGLKRLFEATFGEGAQEMITEVLQGTYNRQELEGMSLKDAILGIDLGNVLHAGALGFFIGGGLAVPGMIADAAAGKQRYDQQGQPPELFNPTYKAGGGQDVMQATRKGKPIPDTYITRDGQVVRDTNAIRNENATPIVGDTVAFDVSATIATVKEEIEGLDESDPYGMNQPVDMLPGAVSPGLISSRMPIPKRMSEPSDLTGELMEDTAVEIPERMPEMDIVGSVMSETSLDEEAHKASTSPKNDLVVPTEGQKDKGNYQKGHPTVQGFRSAIENPAGSQRRPEWPPLKWHYGYVKGTEGADSEPGAAPHAIEQVDAFFRPEEDGGPIPDDGPVFIIDQTNEAGEFDEHKLMFGATTEAEASEAYLANYTPGWNGLGSVSQVSRDELQEWLDTGNQRVAYDPALHPKGEAWADPAEVETPEGKRATPVPEQKAPDEDYMDANEEPVDDDDRSWGPDGRPDLSEFKDASGNDPDQYQPTSREQKLEERRKLAAEVEANRARVKREVDDEYGPSTEPERTNTETDEYLNQPDPPRDTRGLEDDDTPQQKALREGKVEPTVGDTEVDTKEPGRPEPGINEKTGKYNAAESIPAGDEVKDDGADQQDLFDTGEGSKVQAADTFFIGYAQVETGTFSTAHDTVNEPGEVAHMIASIRKHAQELFLAVVTDAKGKVLNIIRHSKGGIDVAAVYPGVMVGAIASTEGAAKVWFAHNHPSGTSTPSGADIKITRKIEELSDGLDLEMMGHVVIGDGEFTYFDTDGIVTDGVEKIPPAPRTKKVSVTERMMRKRRSGPKNGLESPAAVRQYIARLESESGILLLDTQLRPVGVVSITTTEMEMLRDGKQVRRIFSAMDKTNAKNVMMFAKHNTETREWYRLTAVQNLGNFLQKTDANVLDAFVDGASLMESGDGLGNANAPFFRRGDPHAKYDGKQITVPITVEDTGITYTAEMDAGAIMREMETRLDALQELRKCL